MVIVRATHGGRAATRSGALLLAALTALGAAACGSDARGSSDGRLTVVTTVSPITSIVHNVGGDLVDLTGLVPEGVNSHEFEPRPSAAKLLSRADVVYVNGLNLETPTLELAEKVLRDDAEVVALGELAVEPSDYVYDFSFPRSDGDPNPHLWTNPLHGRRFAELVRDDLSRRDPDHAAEYARNTAAFLAKVDALDAALRSASATVPTRKLLTFHDSFPYFAREYGWTVIGAIQPADFAEPSAQEVGRLIEQVRRERVPAIFGSEVFPSPVLEQIGKEAGVRYVDDLRDDDLPGEPGDPEHSYLGLLRLDFVTMVEALGGNASALKALDVADVVDGGVDYGA
jgi:manganese/iron transport system substrate-binding protein